MNEEGGRGNVVRTAGKGDLLGRRRHPARKRGVAYVILEPDHTGDGGPAVLAKPVHLQNYRYPSEHLLLRSVRLPSGNIGGVPAGSRS